MKAYHNKVKIKNFYLDRVEAHFKADEIIKGKYWESGKGCAVGCTIHGSEHKKYETELGIPQMLARLEDRIFEGLPNDEAMKWPSQFLKAIPVGVDLSKVSWKFLQWVLLAIPIDKKYPEIKQALKECSEFLKPLSEGKKINRTEALVFRDKMWALRSKYWPAAAAAYAAAYAAADAAAYAAAYAAADAADAAAAYAAAYAAADAARKKFYSKMAKKLIQLIKAVK